MELTQIGPDGSEIDKETLADSLAPGAKYLDVFNSVLADNPESILKLEADQPLAVMTATFRCRANSAGFLPPG